MNIIYTLNDKFVPQVAACICSVCENNKEMNNINFFVISQGITSQNKNKLKQLVEKYNRNIQIIELGHTEKYFDFEFDTSGWNSIVLARLIIDKLLPSDINKVLYLDGDTIVRGSLKELWDINLEDYVLAASAEPTQDRKRRISLGLEYKLYYNAGVLLINLKKWRKINAEKIILDYYKQHAGKLFANDQDAINGSLNDYIYTLSPKYNFYNIFYQYNYNFLKKLAEPAKYITKDVYDDAVKNPIIIHYLGEERPWRIGNTHKYKNDYINYLNKTAWKGEGFENGWKLYFVCWNIFNVLTKPFPRIRYGIINALIPSFIKMRAKKNKKVNAK